MSIAPDVQFGVADSSATPVMPAAFYALYKNDAGPTSGSPSTPQRNESRKDTGADAIVRVVNGEIFIQVKTGPSENQSTKLEVTFKALMEKWRRESGHLSVLHEKLCSRTYLEIIGLGEPAVPLLLSELQRRPTHLFLALSSITRDNPVRKGANFAQAVEDWITWGQERKLI